MANPRSRLLLAGLIGEILFAFLLLAAVALAILLLDPSGMAVTVSVSLIGVMLFYLLRLYVIKIWQFLLPALILIVGPALIPVLPIWPRLVMTLAMLAVGLRALNMRLRPEPTIVQLPTYGGTIVALIWLFLINRLAVWQDQSELAAACFYIGVVYLLLVLIRQHHMTLTERLSRFEPMMSQPTDRIKRFNRGLLAGFLVLVAMILLLSPWLRLDEVIPWAGSLLLFGLRRMISWLVSLFPGRETPEPQPTEAPAEPPGGGWLPGGDNETPAWMVILQDILYYVLLAGAVAMILAALVYGLYSLYRRFYEQRTVGSDVLEAVGPKLNNQVRETIKAGRRRWDRRFGTSPEQKIRRYYSRLVDGLIHSGREVRPDMTPLEIARLADSADPMTIMELTALYEKARYGNGLCTSDDARRMLDLYRLITTDRRV